jgi:hypothetical protein
MAQWDRASTPWRQGQMLTADAIKIYGLDVGQNSSDVAAVVVSHDCDIAQAPEIEPTIEVIVGRFIEKPNGNFTHAKSPRCLHIQTDGDQRAWVEMVAINRRFLPKVSGESGGPSLVDQFPAERHLLEGKSRKVLQSWLAARYRRSALPDEFDRRLKGQTGTADRLAKLFSEFGTNIHAVFFDVDEGTEVQRNGADDPYELHVTILYDTNVDPQRAEDQAKKAASGIEGIFHNRCRKKKSGVDVWQWIELKGVDVIADTALSYADALLLTKWNAEHISLRPDPQQIIAEE